MPFYLWSARVPIHSKSSSSSFSSMHPIKPSPSTYQMAMHVLFSFIKLLNVGQFPFNLLGKSIGDQGVCIFGFVEIVERLNIFGFLHIQKMSIRSRWYPLNPYSTSECSLVTSSSICIKFCTCSKFCSSSVALPLEACAITAIDSTAPYNRKVISVFTKKGWVGQ